MSYSIISKPVLQQFHPFGSPLLRAITPGALPFCLSPRVPITFEPTYSKGMRFSKSIPDTKQPLAFNLDSFQYGISMH